MTTAVQEGVGAEWRWPFFRDERSFWRMATVLLGVVSFLRGIRYPNIWSATQASINYHQGLVKRGLFGATFGGWLHFERYLRFSLFSYFLMSVLMLMLGLLVHQSGAMRRLGAGEPVAVFFASYALTYMANLVGYLDIPLGILTVGLLLIRDARVRAVAAVPICLVGILIHEMFLIVFLPVVLFSFVADGFELPSGRDRSRVWMIGLMVALVSLGMTLRLALLKPMTETQLAAMRAEIEDKADFPVNPGVFEVFLRSTGDNVRVMEGKLHDKGWVIGAWADLAAFLPTMAMMLAGVWLTARRLTEPRFRGIALGCGLIAALSPLLMYLFGWDSARWDALVCLEAFLVLMVLARAVPGEVRVFSGAYRYVSVLVIALGMATGGILLDGKAENTFPFVLDLHALAYDIKHDGWVCPD
jgi:hypothetical protein